MTAGEAFEKVLDIPIPAKFKEHLDKLYEIYKEDPEAFNKRCAEDIANRGRGQRVPYFQFFMPIIFAELHKQEVNV